jgi:uncharacterized protein with LGFP repeats
MRQAWGRIGCELDPLGRCQLNLPDVNYSCASATIKTVHSPFLSEPAAGAGFRLGGFQGLF